MNRINLMGMLVLTACGSSAGAFNDSTYCCN